MTRLLADAGIIRHRGKIEGTIRSAKAYLTLQTKQGFAPFLWDFVGGSPVQNHRQAGEPVPAQTPQSQALSKALKRAGFTFCGPTITYAFMQAVGMVNDHNITCEAHDRCVALAKPLQSRPSPVW